jgi:uncharacterized iron-regulated membrane protein
VQEPALSASPRWHEWLIAASFLALIVTGVLTVFDDEIDRLRGVRRPQTETATPTVEQDGVPLAPGNTPPEL